MRSILEHYIIEQFPDDETIRNKFRVESSQRIATAFNIKQPESNLSRNGVPKSQMPSNIFLGTEVVDEKYCEDISTGFKSKLKKEFYLYFCDKTGNKNLPKDDFDKRFNEVEEDNKQRSLYLFVPFVSEHPGLRMIKSILQSLNITTVFKDNAHILVSMKNEIV